MWILQESQVTPRSQANSGPSLTESAILFGSEAVSENISDLIQLKLPISILRRFATTFGDMIMNTCLSLTVQAVSDLNNLPVNSLFQLSML